MLYRTRNNFFIVARNLFLVFLLSLTSGITQAKVLVLKNELKELCLCREYVRYFEDTSATFSLEQIIKLNNSFKESRASDLINSNTSSAYWLYFEISSQTDKAFRVELFDYDLDEISFFSPAENGIFTEQKAGYSLPFTYRDVNHKNVSFPINIPKGSTQKLYMRFKSERHNILEPIVRSYDQFLTYGFTEYLLLGIFYGLMLLMIFYNLLYFIMLKKLHFLYFVIYACGILLYMVSENGTGFQYLWPEFPAFNPYSAEIGLSIGIIAMILFSYTFLNLKRKGKFFKSVLAGLLGLRILIFIAQLLIPSVIKWEIADIIFLQLALIAGVWRLPYKPARWYIVAFSVLDASFLISGFEQLGVIDSSVFTVYSFNAGVLLQFIFLSIAVGESIRETYRQKDKANADLVLEYKKNAELKEQMNLELEQMVKDRTFVLQNQNIEIQKQKEEIVAMYEAMEELVKKRTLELKDRNSKIRQYSFTNSHLVRAPLARILGLTNLAKNEDLITPELLQMIQNSASELDEVVRQMNRILDENEK